MRFYPLLVLLCISGLQLSVSSAQSRRILSPAFVPGEFLVQLHPGTTPQRLSATLGLLPGAKFRAVEPVAPAMHLYKVALDTAAAAQEGLLALLRAQQGILIAQHNHKVSYRSTPPNDPQFGQQWQYHNTGQNGGVPGADMNIAPAWDFTTGGLTASGDTVVVCVIDDGIDQSHQDFGDNLWVNRAEIPNNNTDDDQNGYIDDYLGWNCGPLNDDLSDGGFGGGHGTPVAGIVGAKGNNGLGVAGVNWNVKLMIVINAGLDEAEVLAAYAYPLAARKRYNATNGASGAYVVATNASWGVDQGKPTDAPLWCALYDSLGQAGVINCGATANANFNVDVVGDLPTACPSDYLITVTNLNSSDTKVGQAGYGLTTIDLGSYGQGTYTVADGNGYSPFGGTSGATPHVTGTAALLYAAPCPAWAAYQHAHPDSAVRLVKEAILSNTTPNANLAGKTVTGGKINAGAAMQWLMNHFDCLNSCLPPSGLRVRTRLDSATLIAWNALALMPDSFLVAWRPAHAPAWLDSAVVSADSFLITGLLPCSPYEIRVDGFCSGSRTGYSGIMPFKTSGCKGCDQEYCPIIGDSGSEWIAKVTLDTTTHTSGNDGGYVHFSQTTFTLTQGDSVAVTVTPGFSGTSYDEYIRVWADFNNDGDYDDADELAFDPGYVSQSAVTGLFVVPANALPGGTRMRVAMQYETAAAPCGALDYGEVEDYCLNILQFVGIAPDKIHRISVWPQPASGVLHVSGLSGAYTFRLLDMQGRVLSVQQTDATALPLPAVAAGAYLAEFTAGGVVYRYKCLIE